VGSIHRGNGVPLSKSQGRLLDIAAAKSNFHADVQRVFQTASGRCAPAGPVPRGGADPPARSRSTVGLPALTRATEAKRRHIAGRRVASRNLHLIPWSLSQQVVEAHGQLRSPWSALRETAQLGTSYASWPCQGLKLQSNEKGDAPRVERPTLRRSQGLGLRLQGLVKFSDLRWADEKPLPGSRKRADPAAVTHRKGSRICRSDRSRCQPERLV